MVIAALVPVKIILFGEHFVYGKPAVVTAIEKLVHVSVELRSDSS